MVREVRRRARGKCERCGHVETATDRHEIDHVVPLSRARSLEELTALNSADNGEELCLRCHRAKTASGTANEKRERRRSLARAYDKPPAVG
jgi:5-methylcytosine-specific restriction endonuclease McrA